MVRNTSGNETDTAARFQASGASGASPSEAMFSNDDSIFEREP